MPAPDPPAVAIIADAHFHDIHSDYDGAGLRVGGDILTLRSWADTRRSSRVFNESGPALIAALDQIHRRGIRHVVLLGDYADDGQVEATKRLAELLAGYRDRCGMAFYALPGNHDVFGPLGKHQSTRFVTGPATSVLVTSDPKVAAQEADTGILTDKMYCRGMPEALMPMAGFGYFNAPQYIHWETPFGCSDEIAVRMYTARSAGGTAQHRLMDASYLVEPAPGLWLLMIDANVFEPRDGAYRPEQKRAFIDSTDAGWNAVLRDKPFLVDWIADVCRRADQQDKTLLTFSHYPVIDPFEDAEDSERALFGETEIVRRRPKADVADALIVAGLRHHFSGHYHVNGRVCQTRDGRALTNVSVPSLVAFPSGFVIARATGAGCAVEMVPLDALPVDPRVMAAYRAEAAHLGAAPNPALDCGDYGAFLYHQMHSRLAHHYLPHKWPREVADFAEQASLADLAGLFLARSSELADLAGRHGIGLCDLQVCTVKTLAGDWYCLRQAGDMTAGHIDPARIDLYRFMAREFGASDPVPKDRITVFFAVFLDVLGASLRRMSGPGMG